MALQPPAVGRGRSLGLLDSLRRLGSTLVGLVHTRIELIAAEFERERARVTRLLILAIVALFFLGLGLLTLTIFIVVLFWESQRLVAIGFLVVLYFAIGIGAAVFAKREAARAARPFAATRAQLQRDREQLTRD